MLASLGSLLASGTVGGILETGNQVEAWVACVRMIKLSGDDNFGGSFFQLLFYGPILGGRGVAEA